MTAGQIEFARAWVDLHIAARNREDRLWHRQRVWRARWNLSPDEQAEVVLWLARLTGRERAAPVRYFGPDATRH